MKDALNALNEVKNYELVSGNDLVDMFNGRNKNSKESVFELQYSSNTDNGARYYSYVHQFIASKQLGGWDEILPNDFLMNEFKKEGRVRAGGLQDATTNACTILYISSTNISQKRKKRQ